MAAGIVSKLAPTAYVRPRQTILEWLQLIFSNFMAGKIMYKHILVAVDGSDTSKLALQEAINLVKEQQAQLRIVHVVEEVTLNIDAMYVLDAYQEAMRKTGEEVLKKAEAVARESGVKAETRLLEIETLGHRSARGIRKRSAACGRPG